MGTADLHIHHRFQSLLKYKYLSAALKVCYAGFIYIYKKKANKPELWHMK